MGKFVKNLLKVTAATAAVGGLCYAFKDKIKESKVYKDYDVDEKLNKVKTTIKEKMPKVFDNEEDYVEDDEIFFEDEDFNPEDSSRDYVSINNEPAAEADAAAEGAPEETEGDTDSSEVAADTDAASSDDGDIPTIEV